MTEGAFPTSGKAYEIFFAEFGRHLGAARTILKNPANLSSDDRFRLSASFHTIKGGAGFFGLSDIARISSILEKLFKNPDLKVETEIFEIEGLIDELDSMGRLLPVPPK